MKFFITIIMIWLLLNNSVSAATAVSESRFIVKTEPGQIISHDLVVSNLSSVTQQYRLSLPDNNARLASFIPKEFNLAPHQSQNILVRFRAPKKSQKSSMEIIAYDHNQNNNLKIASGIKIPVYFIASPSSVIARESAESAGDRSNLINTPSAVIRLLRFARNDIRFFVFSIDLILFSVVCFLYKRRIFWQQRLMRHKINFV